MDIPIYDPRDDYDYVVVRKPTPQTREQNDPDRSRDQPITPQKDAEQDERSPIQRRLESLKQRAADRRVISPRHPKRERTVQHQQPQEERRRERHHPREVEPRVGRDRLPPIAVDLRLRPEEIRTISEVGRFRVVSARDLTDTLYRGNSGQAERDLSFLRQKNLVNTDFINARRDGRNRPVDRIQVVTLTPEGKALLRETGLGVSSKHLPAGGRHSEQPFVDRILISYDKERKAARFIFMDEGIRSLARFEKFLSDYKRLFTALATFEVIYSSDTNANFSAAKYLFEKTFPQSRAENSHALYPKGAEHLLAYFQVRAQYDAETGGLSMANFLLLREGNLLYTEPDHEKLYQEWRVKPFTADGIHQRVQSKTASVSFRTELLELAYPIFNYRHLPKKPPAIDSIGRSPVRSHLRRHNPLNIN